MGDRAQIVLSDLLTLNALTAAVLIPMQCEYYALEGLTQLMRSIRMVRESSIQI